MYLSGTSTIAAVVMPLEAGTLVVVICRDKFVAHRIALTRMDSLICVRYIFLSRAARFAKPGADICNGLCLRPVQALFKTPRPSRPFLIRQFRRSKNPLKRHVRGRTRLKRWWTCNFGTLGGSAGGK